MLKNFQISIFSIVMGLCGTTIASKKIEKAFIGNHLLSSTFLALAVITFCFFLVIHAFRSFRFFEQVKADWNNSTKLSFFPTISISMLLLSISMQETFILPSKILAIIGCFSHLTLFFSILHSWINKEDYNIKEISPAWFIPPVGNILIPIACVNILPIELNWFCFAIGLMFWVILLTIFIYRTFFHPSIDNHMLPTFFVLIAPPSVGSLSYFRLTGEVNLFVEIMFYIALFFLILNIFQLNRLRKLPFYLSFWAISFPSAAFVSLCFVLYEKKGLNFAMYLGSILFIILITYVTNLIFKTIKFFRSN